MFCEALQLPHMDHPHWYREFHFPSLSHSPLITPQLTPAKHVPKKGKFQKQQGAGPARSPQAIRSMRSKEHTHSYQWINFVSWHSPLVRTPLEK